MVVHEAQWGIVYDVGGNHEVTGMVDLPSD